jgi:anti-sigma regulatory factor (Ser/Thr protein kinase)
MTTIAAFDHLALFYEGDGEFLTGTLPFVEEGLDQDESVMVAVDPHKRRLLERALSGGSSRAVRFVDMHALGHNPARIIPAWQAFLDQRDGRGARGIGEPAWPGRTPVELEECGIHEALLNVAFGGGPAWDLLCPYDVGGLDHAVLERARHYHPGPDRWQGSVPDTPLDPPPPGALIAPIQSFNLAAIREVVAAEARAAGLPPSRSDELVLAVSELAANSLEHGGGGGALKIWSEGATMVCEVTDRGHITDPLVGRRAPTPAQDRGRGLWIANQVCDLVQIRSSDRGTTVRLHVA